MRKASLKQTIYEELKNKIVSCEIAPGERLTEDGLCELMNASRTPVRDAISRLEQEKLVTINSKKGILVNTVSLNNVNELFEARLRIEPYVVREYGNRIRDDVYANCIAELKEGKADRLVNYERDDAFHQMFIDASENRYLIMFYSTIKDQVMRYRVLSDMEDRMENSLQEHSEIALHCLRGNFDLASEAMKRHIENSKIAIINYVLQKNRDAKNIFSEKSR